MTLKEAMYISLSGYGPCSQFSLSEWLHARALFRANEKQAFQAANYSPKDPIK